MTNDFVYGRQAVREALRGRRAVLEVWATERALKAEPWLAEARTKVKSERDLTERAGTRDHQGLVAIGRAVSLRRRLRAGSAAAAAARGARPGDRSAQPRCRLPQRRRRGCDRRRSCPRTARPSSRPAVARASAGAVEHLPVAVVTNLARYLEEVKGPDLWVYGAAGGEGATPMWEADLAGGLALVFGAEGKGLRPLVRRMCDGLVSIPLHGRVESLNVSVAAAVLLYEARRRRDA